MSDDRVPAPVEALIRAIAGGSPEDNDQRATTFARGLAIGVLVGAAIAGSTIWQRRLAHREPPPPRPVASETQPNTEDEAG